MLFVGKRKRKYSAQDCAKTDTPIFSGRSMRLTVKQKQLHGLFAAPGFFTVPNTVQDEIFIHYSSVDPF
jgi:hypothetical protein